MNTGPTESAKNGASPTLVLGAIYAYTLLLNLILPPILFLMFPLAEGETISFALADILPAEMSSPTNLVVYGLGLISFISAFMLPKIIGRKGSTSVVSMMSGGQVDERNNTAQATAPYLIRIVMFETTTFFGFIAAFLAEKPLYIVPLGTLGLIGALMSPPTNHVLKSLTE